jgi:hypothetical protein
VFIAPPWGHTLDPVHGSDLRRTEPPVTRIVEIQTYETIEPKSLVELQERFEWSVLRIYNLNAPGQNHGVALGTCGWRPMRATLPACPLP